MSAPSSEPRRVRLVPVADGEPIPSPAEPAGREPLVDGIGRVDGIALVTGRRLVAAVTGAGGLRDLRLGAEPVGGPLRLRVEGRPAAGAGRASVASGRWERVVVLPGGGRLIERGLLLDELPAALLQWMPTADGESGPTVALDATLETAPDGETIRLEPTAAGLQSVLVVPPGTDPERALALVRHPRARAFARARRGTPHSDVSFQVSTAEEDGTPEARVAGALRVLDDAFPGPPEEIAPGEPMLLGWSGEAPRFLDPTGAAEVGLALLAAGRHEMAWSALRAVALAEPTPPGPLLLLAAQWAHWTGDAARLTAVDEALEAAVSAIADASRTPPDPGAAFPSPARTLEFLADALEPRGEGARVAGLRTGAARLRRPPGGGGRRLPVLGQTLSPEQLPRPEGARLPPPQAFAPVDHPAALSRRTLHAARLVRSWIEGVLGAEPDAAYGRVVLRPDVDGAVSTLHAGPAPPGPGPERAHPGTFRLDVAHLVIGDALVSLACRVEGTRHTFRLFQEAGRVPLNVVFEPRLGLSRVDRVRMGDEDADVEIVSEDGGVRLRCQFPLDPERRVTIDGSA